MLQVAAATDRGQRMNALVAPMYQEKLAEMEGLMDALIPETQDITEASVSGEVSFRHLDDTEGARRTD